MTHFTICSGRRIDQPANGSVEWLCSDDERGWPSGRASAFQADLHGFDSRTPLQDRAGKPASGGVATRSQCIRYSNFGAKRI
jgi:hypothetical protein